MKLISKIVVQNLRSIGNAALEDISDFSILAGINNSGKSNFLRALNVFFTEETEKDNRINVDIDYYRPALRSRKKKFIAVKIYFELPDAFNFHIKLRDVEEFLGGRKFAIMKRWTRADPYPEIYLNDEATPVSIIDRQKIDQFLALISFRYIPNRVLPIEVIISEHKALRDVLVRRLGKAAPSDAVFKRIASTSKKLIEKVSSDVARIGTGIEGVRLDTPSAWAEMLFSFGYKIKEGGFELDDSVQGSGIQSLLMFETLHLIDRDYFQKFGWRQAAIWAIEEPESSMHTSLEVQVASLLSSIANEPNGRLQIIGTSHSDLIIQYADCGYLINRESRGSIAERFTPMELLKKTSQLGVSRFSHPLLFHPHLPLILVEGKFDKIYLEKVLQLLDKDSDVVVSYLEDITEGERSGGINDLLKYIKYNKNTISCRPADAPLIVILDWENGRQLSEFQKIPSCDDRYGVKIWPMDAVNPDLDSSFKGIERFYPTRIIEKGRSDGLDIGEKPDGSYMVSSSYGNIKRHLSTIIRKDLQLDDIQDIKDFIINEVLP